MLREKLILVLKKFPKKTENQSRSQNETTGSDIIYFITWGCHTVLLMDRTNKSKVSVSSRQFWMSDPCQLTVSWRRHRLIATLIEIGSRSLDNRTTHRVLIGQHKLATNKRALDVNQIQQAYSTFLCEPVRTL